jgi:hypothetical protein
LAKVRVHARGPAVIVRRIERRRARSDDRIGRVQVWRSDCAHIGCLAGCGGCESQNFDNEGFHVDVRNEDGGERGFCRRIHFDTKGVEAVWWPD